MTYGTGWIKDRGYTNYIIDKIDTVNKKTKKCPKCRGIGIEHGCIGEGLCPLCLGKGTVPINVRKDGGGTK